MNSAMRNRAVVVQVHAASIALGTGILVYLFDRSNVNYIPEGWSLADTTPSLFGVAAEARARWLCVPAL